MQKSTWSVPIKVRSLENPEQKHMDHIQANRLWAKLTLQIYTALFCAHELQCLNVIHKEIKSSLHLLPQGISPVLMKSIALHFLLVLYMLFLLSVVQLVSSQALKLYQSNIPKEFPTKEGGKKKASACFAALLCCLGQ